MLLDIAITNNELDSLKKYIDDKILELTTKLDLVLGNVGGTVIENNVDLSGLDDFMQRVISLENKFDEFVHKVNIADIQRQLKYLTDYKADKKFKIDEIKTFDDIKFEIEYNYDDPWKIIFE